MAYPKYLFGLLALSCTLLPGFGVSAQNLVPNPGFELYLEHPESDANGSAASVDQVQLPQAAGAYFWRARLQCFRELDQLPFQRTVSGRIILVD